MPRTDYNYCCSDRIDGTEVRVGPKRPFERNTKGSTIYSFNSVCGSFDGPTIPTEATVIPCSTPVVGRYVTLQRIVRMSNDPALNLNEVIIDSEPVDLEPTYVFLRHSDSEPFHVDSQCPESHPLAFSQGRRCCEGNLEKHPKDDDAGTDLNYRKKGGKGLLHFDSKECAYPSVVCEQAPCLNYNFAR